jgi:transposase
MDVDIKKRMIWIKVYEESKDAGITCRKCGISRPTLRKWLRRYEQYGEIGLTSKNRKPLHSPAQKVFEKQESWILEIRKERRLGARGIQHEMVRLHDYHLSLATIHKILHRHLIAPLHRLHRKKKFKRYEKKLPAERVQLDVVKTAPGNYQYTADDDYSRFMVTALYSRSNAKNTLNFLDLLVDAFVAPVQYIQTDRGAEFMADEVQV